jgi:hypothetical protein
MSKNKENSDLVYIYQKLFYFYQNISPQQLPRIEFENNSAASIVMTRD